MSVDSQSDYNSNEDDSNISPLAYARANGIAIDHLGESAAFKHVEKLQERAVVELTVDSRLPCFSFREEFALDEENLVVSKDATALLSSVSQFDSWVGFEGLVHSMLDDRQTKRLKLDLPVLKTDHETDCKDFSRREGFEIGLSNLKLPLEIVSEENNEGLSFPPRFWNVQRQKLAELKKERLKVTKETLLYLQRTTNREWTDEDDSNLRAESIYKRNPALNPVTPPLSPPLSSLASPNEKTFSSPAYHVPILSDPPFLAADDLQALETKLFEQDIPTPLRNNIATSFFEDESVQQYTNGGHTTSRDFMSSLLSSNFSDNPEIEESRRLKREDLKVEVPLMCSIPPDHDLTNPISFKNIAKEMDLSVPSSSPHIDILTSKFFEEAFGDAYLEAKKASEQEKLVEADANARVQVPKMDFSKPEAPPWKTVSLSREPFHLLSEQKSMIKKILTKKIPLWPGAMQGSLKLGWTPFPANLAKVDFQDRFNGHDDTWEALVKGQLNKDIIDSSVLTWKPPGLRILKCDDESEEEHGSPDSLINNTRHMKLCDKKRKVLEEKITSTNKISQPKSIAKETSTETQTTQTSTRDQDSTPTGIFKDGNQVFGSLLAGEFSAETSIENFLEIRGVKRPKLVHNHLVVSKPDEFSSMNSVVKPSTVRQETLHLPIRKSPVTKFDTVPVPAIKHSDVSIHIIASIEMMKSRPLITALEKTLTGLTIIERDFNAQNTTIWLPGSVSRSPVASPLASEADFILSPSTGVLLTTFQKIRQKPLPGQKGKSQIRERLEGVSLRYNQLYVLVSEDKLDEMTSGLDSSACISFTEFVGFATGLKASVSVLLVIGGQEALSKWLMSLILRHQYPEELLSDETHWELFLRRAGMNAYAAQMVIMELKVPDHMDGSRPHEPENYGLTAFVRMDREVRNERFGNLCGISMLERVSSAIDAKWQ